MPKMHDIAGDHYITIPVPIQGTAGATTPSPHVPVPFDCEVQELTWVPTAAVTANATNYAVLTVTNGGQTGAGTSAIGARSYAATNSVALTAEDIPTLTNTTLAEGDLLYVARTVGASGVATPEGSFVARVRAV